MVAAKAEEAKEWHCSRAHVLISEKLHSLSQAHQMRNDNISRVPIFWSTSGRKRGSYRLRKAQKLLVSGSPGCKTLPSSRDVSKFMQGIAVEGTVMHIRGTIRDGMQVQERPRQQNR